MAQDFISRCMEPEAEPPPMPRRKGQYKHREKIAKNSGARLSTDNNFVVDSEGDPEYIEGYACVARPVNKKELAACSPARAAMDKEWNKLRGCQNPKKHTGAWDENKVEEWGDIARRARGNHKPTHVGRIFGICVEKGSELPIGDPGRKFKGRYVFQGNQVRDQENNYAIFADLSSAPATMQAGKCADAYGLFQGNTTEQSDGESAYTQAKLGGVPTYVRLPPDRWPPGWREKGMRDPVCPLILALYGHPDAGGFWEKHCYNHLKAQGFMVIDQWNSAYWHKKKQLLTSTISKCLDLSSTWPMDGN